MDSRRKKNMLLCLLIIIGLWYSVEKRDHFKWFTYRTLLNNMLSNWYIKVYLDQWWRTYSICLSALLAHKPLPQHHSSSTGHQHALFQRGSSVLLFGTEHTITEHTYAQHACPETLGICTGFSQCSSETSPEQSQLTALVLSMHAQNSEHLHWAKCALSQGVCPTLCACTLSTSAVSWLCSKEENTARLQSRPRRCPVHMHNGPGEPWAHCACLCMPGVKHPLF